MNYFNQYRQQPVMPSNVQMDPRFSMDQYSGVQGQFPLMNPSSGITWVQGEIGARAYPVDAGKSVLLMDSEDKYFYIKSADMSGMPKMHKYYYSEVFDEEPKLLTSNSSETREDKGNEKFDQMLSEINELKSVIQELTAKMASVNTQQQGG